MVLSAFGYMASVSSLAVAVPELVGACALVVLALACWQWLPPLATAWHLPLILGVALLIRLWFVELPPQLSDDIYRYLWDGWQVLQGHNPYSQAPAAMPVPESAFWRQVQERINHPHLVTIYPPLAQLGVAAALWLGRTLVGFKAVLCGLDLLLCLVLARLLHLRGQDMRPLVLYAWHPLPVLEIAGSGHIDGIACLFLLLALWWGYAARTATAGALGASAAVWTKLFPALFVPGLFLHSRYKGRFVLTGLLSSGVLLAFYMPEIQNGWTTLVTYLRHWQFAGGAYQLLAALGGGGPARLLLAGSLLAAAGLWHGWWLRNGALWQQLPQLWLALVLAYMWLTPTLHPWYGLYLVALLPLAPRPWALVFSWSVLLSYAVLLPYTIQGQWQELSWATAYVSLAPGAAWLLCRVAQWRLGQRCL